MSVVCVTLNPAEDRVALVDPWPPEGTVRPKQVFSSAGGKGVNVARALRAMGRTVMTTGIAAGPRGAWLIDRLQEEGLNPAFTTVPGETRLTYTLAGPDGETLVVAENGPEVSESGFSEFLAVLDSCLGTSANFVVVSGSLPRLYVSDPLGDIVDVAHAAGKKVLIDTSGPGLRTSADIVKANLAEAEEAGLGADAAQAASVLVADGADIAMITLGRGGAVLADRNGVIRQPSPEVAVVSTVGAGDVATAGLVSSLLDGDDLERALATAVVAGAAACLDPRAGYFDVDWFSAQVTS